MVAAVLAIGGALAAALVPNGAPVMRSAVVLPRGATALMREEIPFTRRAAILGLAPMVVAAPSFADEALKERNAAALKRAAERNAATKKKAAAKAEVKPVFVKPTTPAPTAVAAKPKPAKPKPAPAPPKMSREQAKRKKEAEKKITAKASKVDTKKRIAANKVDAAKAKRDQEKKAAASKKAAIQAKQAQTEKYKQAKIARKQEASRKSAGKKRKGGGNIFSALGNLVLLGGAGVAALTFLEDSEKA